MPLVEALDRVPQFRKAVSNAQSRQLFGPKGSNSWREVTSGMHTIIGKTEFFGTLVNYLETLMHIPLCSIDFQKVGDYSDLGPQLAGAESLLEDLNADDIALYNSFGEIYVSNRPGNN